MKLMLIVAALLLPYLVALAAFALLAKRTFNPWITTLGACLLIISAPWLIPADALMLRFVASISAAVLALKVIDVSIDLEQQRVPTWREYMAFLANPFTHVRRCLALERRPPWRENLMNLVASSVGCTVGVALLLGLFNVDGSRWSWGWGLGSSWGFLVEHICKTVALLGTISSALAGTAAAWRLCGGTARDFMDKPYLARTPAEFWRRYNRNVQQFFWQDVFKTKGGRRAPIRTMLGVFALSALLHELIFFAALGRVQGYQTAFFLVQGIAAAATARIKVKGWLVIPWTAGTLAFNLVSSVLFFASIHGLVPFYSLGLPQWLQGW